jgi:hypothetical protein
MNTFQERIIRAAKLDSSLYEEVEADPTAMMQAMGVVILSGIAAGIGSVWTVGFKAIFSITIASIIGWFIWAAITYFIGTKFIPEPQTRSNIGELLRTIGFSSSPGMIRVLGIIPALSWISNFIAAVWMLVAMVIAVRQALDYQSTLRAIVVCAVGWIIQYLLIMLLYFIF